MIRAEAGLRKASSTILVVASHPGAAWLRLLDDPEHYRLEHLPETLMSWSETATDDVDCVLVALATADISVLADLLLPCQQLPDLPVVVVSAVDDPELAVTAVRFGAHDFVACSELGDGDRLRTSVRFAAERRRAQVERRVAEARYQAAFAHAPTGMAILDGNGRVVEANDAMGRLLGRPAGEVVGTLWRHLIAADDDVLFLLGTPSAPAQVRFRRADGSPRWGRLGASPVEVGHGENHVVITLEDVSETLSVQRRLEELLAENERRLRYEVAIAECSNVLLRAVSNKDLDPALHALLDAVEGTSIFVDMNVDDPEAGFCTSLVHEVSHRGAPLDFDVWGMVPWAELPESHAALSRGELFTMNVSELGPVERKVYVDMEIRSEANAPIFVDGQWLGTVGFADRLRERTWSDSELRLLRTAAGMIGAFWEKQEVRASLERAVADGERRIRYEHALFEASRALLITDDERALPAAVDALLGVTEATDAFVERNREHPELGLCTEMLHSSTLCVDGTIDHMVDPYWDLVPWSDMPDSFVRLSQGEPHAFTLADLGATERAVYERSPAPFSSEIDIPIFVDGVWAGLVGFADRNTERAWDPTEVRLLQTAADMIGAFWSRRESQARMRSLMRSKDEFLASVSHELRTPLTTVVGLSAELRDRPDDFAPAESAELVGLIANEASEMANLVADLLIAGREEIGGVAVHPEPIDLDDEVRGVVRSVPHDKHVAVRAAAAVRAWADPVRTRQIVRNLFTNALRYGGDNLRFEISREEGMVSVCAIDDGEPIPPSDQARIFEPYHRAHHTPSQPGSVGLGLTVSRRLARLMGGDLVYRDDGANVFELTLPAAT